MQTAEIFAHLVAKARPMYGANSSKPGTGSFQNNTAAANAQPANRGSGPSGSGSANAGPSEYDVDLDQGAPVVVVKKSAQSRRKLALSKQISRNNRKNRLVNNIALTR